MVREFEAVPADRLQGMVLLCQDKEPFRPLAAFWPIEIAVEFLVPGMAVASPVRIHFKPFFEGENLIKSQSLGPTKNQSGGVDSGVIPSIEISPPRRRHFCYVRNGDSQDHEMGLSETLMWRARAGQARRIALVAPPLVWAISQIAGDPAGSRIGTRCAARKQRPRAIKNVRVEFRVERRQSAQQERTGYHFTKASGGV
jgi:hypothetical protein